MKIKSIFLFLLFIFTFQIGNKISPVFAQTDKSIQDIKEVIEQFLEGMAHRDLNSVMKHTSIHYSSTDKNGKVIDYDGRKAEVEKNMTYRSHVYTDFSISDLQILASDIQDNRAIIDIQWNWKGFNLDTLKLVNGISKRRVALTKEDNTWKIIQMKPLEQSKE